MKKLLAVFVIAICPLFAHADGFSVKQALAEEGNLQWPVCDPGNTPPWYPIAAPFYATAKEIASTMYDHVEQLDAEGHFVHYWVTMDSADGPRYPGTEEGWLYYSTPWIPSAQPVMQYRCVN